MNRARRRGLKIGFILTVWVACGAGVFLAGRAILRRLWPEPTLTIQVDPPRPVHVFDPLLGYRTAPGSYVVTKAFADPARDGDAHLAYHATMGADGYRVTGPEPSGDRDRDRPEVWIFGCSFTWGMGLDDDQTYPWLVQRALPGVRVRNFGVSGYGNLHALLQLRDALVRGERPPAVAVFAYDDFHLPRNAGTHAHLSAIRACRILPTETLSFPRARLAPDGSLVTDLVPIVPPPRTPDPSHAEQVAITRAIFREIAALCRARGIAPVLAFQHGDDDDPVVASWRDRGLPIADIRVDYREPGWNCLPFDHHPNDRANRVYARGVVAALHALDGPVALGVNRSPSRR